MKIKDIPAVDVKEEQIEIILESIIIEQDIPLTWSIDEQGIQNDDGTITPAETFTLEQTTGEEADIVDGQIINKLIKVSQSETHPKYYIRFSATADNNPDNKVTSQITFYREEEVEPSYLLEWAGSTKEWAGTWTYIHKPITIAVSYLGKPATAANTQIALVENDDEIDIDFNSVYGVTNDVGIVSFSLILNSPVVDTGGYIVLACGVIGEHRYRDIPIIFKEPVLPKPFIVAMNDGVVNDADIIESIQGIRANVTLSESGDEIIPAGSILGFVVDNVVYEQSIEEDTTGLSLVIHESLLTNGEHYVGFYVVDFSGKANFSSLSYMKVERISKEE